MYRRIVVVSIGVVALLTASSAQAGFVEINVDSTDGELIGTAINIGGDRADVSFGEIFEEGQDSFAVNVSGVTDSDPVMTITKVIENNSGFTWPGYQIELLNPLGATFVGTPVSNEFTFNSSASTSTLLVFGAPGSVPDDESVTFVFDINVPTTGQFGFTISQTAVPEPATLLMGLLMAGAGTAVALRYRWG